MRSIIEPMEADPCPNGILLYFFIFILSPRGCLAVVVLNITECVALSATPISIWRKP